MAVDDDFDARMSHLIDSCGVGVLTADVVVDQVYAKYQELRDDLRIHVAGRHHYTRDALFENLDAIMGMFADALVTVDGSDVRGAAERVAEKLAAGVYEMAPLEFGDLKASGHPTATDDGATYYDRPPMVHRLTREELRIKGDLRRLGLGNNPSDDHVDTALGLA